MSEPPPVFDALVQAIDHFTLPEAVNWLREVISNREYRLAGTEITSAEGLRGMRLSLPKTGRDLLAAALTQLIAEWVSAKGLGWADDLVSEMLHLVREFRPVGIRTQFEALLKPFLAGAERENCTFDELSPPAQSLILEILGDWSPVHSEFWTHLASRDPSRFSLHAFYALVPISWRDALGILCTIPPTPGNLASLSFSTEWLESAIPPNGQATYLATLVDALALADPAVSETIRKAFQANGIELPSVRPAIVIFDWAAVYTVSKRKLRPIDPLGSRR